MENDNKLIADFLGLERSEEEPNYKVRIPHFFIDDKGNWISNRMVARRDFSEYADTYQDDKGNGYELSFSDLDFDRSWDWLMPVVEKIESLSYSVYIKTRGTTIQDENENLISFEFKNKDSKIEHCYIAVVEFIEWYNSTILTLP